MTPGQISAKAKGKPVQVICPKKPDKKTAGKALSLCKTASRDNVIVPRQVMAKLNPETNRGKTTTFTLKEHGNEFKNGFNQASLQYI